MATASVAGWAWARFPEAWVDDLNTLRCDGDSTIYVPGESLPALLTDVQRIASADDVARFAQRWGPLGFARMAGWVHGLDAQHLGALRYALASRKPTRKVREKEQTEAISKSVDSWFWQQPDVKLSQVPDNEPVEWFLRFSENCRLDSELLRIRGLYREDPFAADYDAKEWLAALTSEQYQNLVGLRMEYWEKEYASCLKNRTPGTEERFLEFLIRSLLVKRRMDFSDRSARGVWVAVHPDGPAVFQFEGLFRFIEYALLAEGAPTPRRCADPKCRGIFFSERSSRRYCPPPPGKNRSQCEQRRSKEKSREKAAKR